ncbi:MAG: CBS domain-containing protein [Lachnospiraceae bacterium]|nr:CBS domain-containing protein [Candidatus Fimimorpha excrementavium]
MLVKAIMIPFSQLQCLSVDDTLDLAIRKIENNRLLSLPVVDKKTFVGILSKQYVFEMYFKEFSEMPKEEYLQKKVEEMIKTVIDPIREDCTIEEAAAIFINSKIRFIPITNEKGELLGIVTQQAIFKEYQKIFGEGYNPLTIYTYNARGVLANISEIIAKDKGNIRNIVLRDTDVMGLQEVNMRIECDNFEKIVHDLKKNDFNVHLQGSESSKMK